MIHAKVRPTLGGKERSHPHNSRDGAAKGARESSLMHNPNGPTPPNHCYQPTARRQILRRSVGHVWSTRSGPSARFISRATRVDACGRDPEEGSVPVLSYGPPA